MDFQFCCVFQVLSMTFQIKHRANSPTLLQAHDSHLQKIRNLELFEMLRIFFLHKEYINSIWKNFRNFRPSKHYNFVLYFQQLFFIWATLTSLLKTNYTFFVDLVERLCIKIHIMLYASCLVCISCQISIFLLLYIN